MEKILKTTLIMPAIVKRHFCAALIVPFLCSSVPDLHGGTHMHRDKGKISARHFRTNLRTPKLLHPLAVRPLLDTTSLETTHPVQRSLTEEINRWSMVRYRHGGSSPRGVDCSGFTSKVFEHALSLNLPRTSRAQALVGGIVERDSLAFGDLLFFYTKRMSRHKQINHVAIYVGDGYFVHSQRRHGVGIGSLSESYYAKHFAWAKRILSQPSGSSTEQSSCEIE